MAKGYVIIAAAWVIGGCVLTAASVVNVAAEGAPMIFTAGLLMAFLGTALGIAWSADE